MIDNTTKIEGSDSSPDVNPTGRDWSDVPIYAGMNIDEVRDMFMKGDLRTVSLNTSENKDIITQGCLPANLKLQAIEVLNGYVATHPDMEEAIDAFIAGLDLIQSDTIFEFYSTIDHASSTTPTRLFARKNEMMSVPLEVINERTILFLLFSNLMNRGDEKVETVLSKTHREDGLGIGSELLDKVLTRGVSAQFLRNDKIIRISPLQMLDYLMSFVETIGVSTGEWQIDNLIKSQRDSIERLRDLRLNDVRYSISEALQYKENTVIRYFEILTSIIFDSLDERSRYQAWLLSAQRTDDMSDILQDENTQLNPYVALLKEFDLFESYKRKFAFCYTVEPRDPLSFFMRFIPRKKRKDFRGEKEIIDDFYNPTNE